MFLFLISVFLSIATVFVVYDTIVRCYFFFSTFRYENSKEFDDDVWKMLLCDLGLIGVFILQHSLMASSFYKDTIGKSLGSLQRSVYTMATGASIKFLFDRWQPINSVVIWSVDLQDHPSLYLFFSLLHTVAWVVLVLQHILMEPWCFVGIKQMYYNLKGDGSPFQYMSQHLQLLIQHLPHPGVLCFLLILWVCPHLTIDRWLLSTLLTWYICLQPSVTQKDYIYTEEQVYGYSVIQKYAEKNL